MVWWNAWAEFEEKGWMPLSVSLNSERKFLLYISTSVFPIPSSPLTM